MNDIDLTGQTWSSITGFSGILDGNGYEVKGLTAPLFDGIAGGQFVNLALTDVQINITGDAGALAKTLGGEEAEPCEIRNIYVSGVVKGTGSVGGIIGQASGVDNQMTVSACINTGEITGVNGVGGILGSVKCSSVREGAKFHITGTANSGTVKGTSKVGGILGGLCLLDEASGYDAYILVERSYNVGVIDSISSYSGGIAGYAEVPGTASTAQAVKIENCYNMGKMKDGGNIVGEAAIASGSVSVSKCIGIQIYNSSTMGIIDRAAVMNEGTTGYCTLSDCYYYSATGEYAFTAGGRISGTATALSAAQMKTASSFTNFDFTNVWAVSSTQNQGYPYLQGMQVMPISYAAPAKGTILQDARTGGSYKVTAAGMKVTYMGALNPSAETVTIPSEVEIDGYTYEVTAIASRAFYNNTALKKITIPGSVTVINCGAFYNCTSLKTVSGCAGVEKIYKNAFRNCKKLTTLGGYTNRVTLKSARFIGKNVFWGCSSVKAVLLSATDLTTIGSWCFRNCTSMTKFNVASTASLKIGKGAFYRAEKLKTIIIKNKNLTSQSFGSGVFKGIRATAVFTVPSAKTAEYRSIFQSRGAKSTIRMKTL